MFPADPFHHSCPVPAVTPQLENAPPAAASEPEVRARDKTVRYAFYGAIVLALATLLVAMTHPPGRVFVRIYQEWFLWLPVVQAVVMSAIVVRHGWPLSTRGRCAFVGMNSLLLLLAGLHAFSALEYACIRTLQILLRIAVLGAWSVAVFGAPFVLFWIWRRARGDRRAFPFARWWFACLILLLASEPLAAVIRSNREKMDIPVLSAAPPPGEFHIAAVGESSMLGWPYVTRDDGSGIYDSRFSIPAVYAWRLQQMFPDTKIVMHNVAVQGLNLKMALKQLEQLEYRPHHLLMYAGHNEFYHDVEELSVISKPLFFWLDSRLEASPTFFLLNNELAARSALRELLVGSGRTFADHPVANPLAYQHRVQRFRGQLRQLAEYCEANGITTQWIIPASAESVYEPDRSVVAAGTTKAEISQMEARYREALELEAAKEWEAAATIYREELAKQPGFAEFHFRLAECLEQLQQYDEARRHFLLARDTDGCPTRANSDFCRQESEVAEEFGIPHFDAAVVLRPQTPHGIIDRSMIHDNVHPTLRAFFLLGMAAADQVQQTGQLEPLLGEPRSVGPATPAEAVRGQRVTGEDREKE